MKQVLFITSHFAPDSHVGAKRAIKFSKYLPEFGIQPVILTMDPAEYIGVDESLNEELQKNLNIIRVKSWHPLRNIVNRSKSLIAIKKNPSISNLKEVENSSLNSKLIKLLDYILFYDYHWLLPALFEARKILKKHKIDIIYTTGPIYEYNIVGLLLKVFTGKKWVCEFRDPWIFLPTYSPNSTFQKVFDLFLLKLILKKANHMITLSKTLKNNFLGLIDPGFQSNFSVIYNGFDMDDFNNLINTNYETKKELVITYLGTWANVRRPDILLTALSNLLEKHNDYKGKIQFNFIGESKLGSTHYDPDLDSNIKETISKLGLKNVINVLPYMPYKNGLQELFDSDVLLYVTAPAHEQAGCLSSKLFEYLCAKKPILALTPPGGEAAKIIRECKIGVIVDPDNIGEISDKIYDMYSAWKLGKLKYNFNDNEIAKYNRRKQVKQLADIFHSLSLKS